MNDPTFDPEVYYHKTDSPDNEEMADEANDLIDAIEDAITDLSYFSVRHDDIFSDQVGDLEEDIKRTRQQI